MLRESVELTGGAIDFDGLTDPACTEIRGIANSRELLEFTNACMEGDAAARASTRRNLVDSMGSAAMIDAVGIISNFQRMVRIADTTGIPTDGPMQVISADLCKQLGINNYASAANSKPPTFFRKLVLNLIGVRMFRKMIRESSTLSD